MPGKIVGNVHWIQDGQQTQRVVDAEAAFSDPVQAGQQVLFAEASGDREQIRLVRLAYRQFQGMRYRGENKAGRPNMTKAGKKALGGKGVAKKSIKKRVRGK